MRFGLFLNTERPGRSVAATVEEDLWELVAGDDLGFEEAWVTEHFWPAEFVISQAAASTKRIRMGPAVRPIAFYHPLQVALDANLCDQMTNGRYMLGFGYGGPPGVTSERMARWGLGDDSLRRPRMYEAIDLIMRALTAQQPFDYEGEFWTGRGIHLPVAAVQQPHIPIAVANAGSTETAALAGGFGFISLRSQLALPADMRKLTERYVESALTAGRVSNIQDIRASQLVWVSRTMECARQEARSFMDRYVAQRKTTIPHWFKRVFPDVSSVGDISWDDIIESGCYFIGDPDRVCELIKRYHDESGGFGVFLLGCGKDFGTREQRFGSMRLFMEAVAPQLASL